MNTNKIKYEFVKAKFKGGGTWGSFSFDNDDTHDMLGDYYRNDGTLVNDAKMNDLLTDMHLYANLQMMKDYPHEKNFIFSDYQFDTSRAGVIVYLLLQCKKIKKFLLRWALVSIYKDYLKVYINKKASMWANYKDRIESIIIEIQLINYCINYGSLKKIIKYISGNINTADILSGNISINKNNAKILKFIAEHKIDFMDNLFLSNSHEFPRLDPRIPQLGTVMESDEGYFINRENNGIRSWTPYDPTCELSYNYLDDSFLSAIYGKK